MFDKLGRQARSAATPLDAAKANKMAESVANAIGIFIIRHPSCWAPFNLLSNRHQGHNGLLHPDEERCAPLALNRCTSCCPARISDTLCNSLGIEVSGG